MLRILKAPHPLLSSPCKPVDDIEKQVIVYIKDMRHLLVKHKLNFLAANQVGLPYMFFIDVKNVYINPVMDVLSEQEVQGKEGSISLPQGVWEMKRYTHIQLKYIDIKDVYRIEEGKFISNVRNLKDKESLRRCIVWQQAMDHMEGKLINDHGRGIFYEGQMKKEKYEHADPRKLKVMSLHQLQEEMRKKRAMREENPAARYKND